jgi:hypothetical protein
MVDDKKLQQIKAQLEFWELMGSGPNSMDPENKKQVSVVQGLLKRTGDYKGNITGVYDSATQIARSNWVKKIMKDPDFNWALIKKSAREIFSEE